MANFLGSCETIIGVSYCVFIRGLKMSAGRSDHFRLVMCPKCKKRFYDQNNGRCYACGFKGWGLFRPEEAKFGRKYLFSERVLGLVALFSVILTVFLFLVWLFLLRFS
jgi:ribosomal protein L37E